MSSLTEGSFLFLKVISESIFPREIQFRYSTKAKQSGLAHAKKPLDMEIHISRPVTNKGLVLRVSQWSIWALLSAYNETTERE